jgi:hypothetical protein
MVLPMMSRVGERGIPRVETRYPPAHELEDDRSGSRNEGRCVCMLLLGRLAPKSSGNAANVLRTLELDTAISVRYFLKKVLAFLFKEEETSEKGWKVGQTPSLRGCKSRNKVSIGESIGGVDLQALQV